MLVLSICGKEKLPKGGRGYICLFMMPLICNLGENVNKVKTSNSSYAGGIRL